MELLQTTIVIESLALAVLLGIVVAWFYFGFSRRILDLRVFGLLIVMWFYCMPAVLGAFSPTILNIVIPLERPDVMLPVTIAVPLLVFSVLAGLLVRWGAPKRPSLKAQRKLDRDLSTRYHIGSLFLFSLICFSLAFVGIYKELHAVGGWLGVIHGGGQAYIEARVTKVLGFWGVLITLLPIASIGLMYCSVRSRVVPAGLRLPLAAAILCCSTGLVALLTTRHLILMLSLSVLALLEMKSRRLFRFVMPVLLALLATGAFGLASFRYSSHVRSIDKLAGNFEHIEITERITSTVHVSGFIWGGNIPDLVTFAIPRAVWPNKPMGNRITRTVFFEYAKEGGVKVPGIIGEAYASAGLIGVVVEGFIYGILLRRLAIFWDRRRGNALLFTSWGALLVGFIYMAVRIGLIGPHDSAFLIAFFQIYLIRRLCGYRIETAARDAAFIMRPVTSPLVAP